MLDRLGRALKTTEFRVYPKDDNSTSQTVLPSGTKSSEITQHFLPKDLQCTLLSINVPQ